jgi:hypothetical protein
MLMVVASQDIVALIALTEYLKWEKIIDCGVYGTRLSA